MTLNHKELARIGDPNAIAAFINRSLNSKGIKANVSGENGYLRVMLISAQIPPQEALVTFVRNGMTSLGVESIHTVQVGGYQDGNDFPAWQEEIQLLPSHDNMFFDNDDDDDDDDDNYMLPESNDFMDQAHANNPMSGDDGFSDDDFASDEQVEEEEMEEPQPEKKPLLSKPLLILIPVLLLGAIAGGVFMFKDSIPFLSSKPPEAETPSPSPTSASPSAKASSPGAKEVPNTTKTASPTPKAGSPSVKPTKSASPTPLESVPPGGASPTPKATTSASPKPPSPTPKATTSASPKPSSPTPKATTSTSPKPPSPTPKASPSGQASKTVSKPWYDAVNKALAASNAVQKAKTPAEWQKVVTLWEDAIDLMKKVPQSDTNYALAQQKAVEYEKNLTYAKGNAGSEQ